jgi:hypothetical protein
VQSLHQCVTAASALEAERLLEGLSRPRRAIKYAVTDPITLATIAPLFDPATGAAELIARTGAARLIDPRKAMLWIGRL